MHKILICDDDADIVSSLRIYLSAEGYEVLSTSNGREALKVLAANPVQLVLLDVMMPHMDGIAVLNEIRGSSNVPVILLTAKSEDTDKVLGLNLGADDYVTKPFNPVELLARVRSQIRRYTSLGGGREGEDALRIGDIELRDKERTVTVNGEPVSLTPTEFDLLKTLMEHPGQVFSPSDIYRAIGKGEPVGADGAIAVHIRHLREKVEIDPAEPRFLKVVWGKGYKIEEK